jgi:hypothetical protein
MKNADSLTFFDLTINNISTLYHVLGVRDVGNCKESRKMTSI